MGTDQGVSLLSHGDQLEMETWAQMQPYLSKYEVVWRMHVVPLRVPASIYLRFGIDPNLERFAMNNYTAYVNMTRALKKIDEKIEDFKFSEEIWANLQRAVEVAIKAATAWSDLYRDCIGLDPKINTAQLDSAENDIKIYRNRLHDPIPATLKDEYGHRLIPERDKIEKYERWTEVMYGCDLFDFVPVERQLRNDFSRVCSALQGFWAQIEKASINLSQSAEYQKRIAAAALFEPGSPFRAIEHDSSLGATPLAAKSFSGSFNISDSPPSYPSWFKIRDDLPE
jgi:hypothetical protein